MSFKVHVIHDLNYNYNEPTDPEDLQIPDVDLVILNGNIGNTGKRSWRYAFEIAKVYPNIHFVFNDGYYERYRFVVDKVKNEYEDSMSIRQKSSDWPSNLHWKDPRDDKGLFILLQTGQTISVWPCFGFPDIVSYDNWEDTWFFRNVCEMQKPVADLEHEIFLEEGLKLHSAVMHWATPKFIKEQFEDQNTKLRHWETQQIAHKHYGIVVTHLNPIKDPRLDNIKYGPYKIHMYNRLWVTTHQNTATNFLGAKLYSNPGRGSIARGKVIEVD